MDQQDNIQGIVVTLLVCGKQALFVLVAADGSINRMGTGSVRNTERDMFIGMTSPDAFQQLRGRISEELLQWCGQSLSAPDKRGAVCELTIGFQTADGQELMTAFEYGSESQGPPPEVCAFVVAAVEATTPWYEQQKRMVNQGGSGNRWWQFWK